MANSFNYRQYGASTSVWFQSIVPAANAVYAAGFIAGTSQISKDGGAFVNTTALPTYVGNGVYNITLTAAEMQATFVVLTFIAGAGANVPVEVQIDTKMILSKIFVGADTLPAANIGLEVRGGGGGGEAVKFWPTAANNSGMVVIGNGTGPGLYVQGGDIAAGITAQGGATSGSGFDSRSQGAGVSGAVFTGVGGGSGIFSSGGAAGNGITGQGNGFGQGFFGGGFRPTNFFDEPIEDITGAPNPGVTTFRQGLAAVVARLFYLVTQTTTQQKQYKSDSATLVGTAPVSDDGVTQSKGRAV